MEGMGDIPLGGPLLRWFSCILPAALKNLRKPPYVNSNAEYTIHSDLLTPISIIWHCIIQPCVMKKRPQLLSCGNVALGLCHHHKSCDSCMRWESEYDHNSLFGFSEVSRPCWTCGGCCAPPHMLMDHCGLKLEEFTQENLLQATPHLTNGSCIDIGVEPRKPWKAVLNTLHGRKLLQEILICNIVTLAEN